MTFVSVIASNYAPFRKSLCDLPLRHVVLFITTELLSAALEAGLS